ncbi:MAG: deoxyribonuclease IV [Dehalococcoidia bacterium]|nr:MAG: deoxyribonuclease IV [Dehalococcoidia bacterium]
MRIGAHISTAGGLEKGIERAQAMGAETIQIFGAPPQTWRRKAHPPQEVEAFRAQAAAADIWPVFIHAVYLVNLATSNRQNLIKSQDALIADMVLSSAIGAKGVIFHIGSHRGAGYEKVFSQIVDSVRRVLAETPDDSWLILENSAGMGDSIGRRFSELADIMKEVASPRLKVCFDTQHAFSSGYDVATTDGLAETVDEFEREVGLAHLVAIHANDSKCPLAGGVDRHENIGEGHIGRAGFEVIVAHAAFRDLPFLLEVPGFPKEGKKPEGPDKENVDRLKAIAAAVG